ncbi:hypothetical protein [Brevibacillus laterosporus]|uniref:hypothetical protein n=1 Tax=Brevibacillus laterosporus TaxID=1465 RepID=UPI00264DE972|nr:hypothetical protein [Brevibacillus laterosporus]MDN9010363.1 hypothetical protein [Brevibacillus laterosporus]MDO0941250.1 hypothetical protein [Brevibacillus laterosporus]
MLAQEMGMVLTKHAEVMDAKRWANLIEQMEKKGLYVVIETDTNCRMLSPLGGLMPMPSKNQQLTILTEEELLAKGLDIGHHIVKKQVDVASGS